MILTLTDTGQTLIDSIAPMLQRINVVLFDGQSAQEFRALGALTKIMLDNSASALAIADLLANETERKIARRAHNTKDR